ncbi:major facilitator superfamily domain-containing protein [Aspergillus welwitschiae]|uniref:Major facilitator superfamily domain-containing protein n=1 Tax=Aspergillus welwitschiae TaxID=1341132 RepID=A0A3F3Q0A5_9EURO|nr:major facilitator superfamily domain-containing protein [Aspergillus welwitschiae]RDH32561.1 major facilitator superfamily domain-containing protein [Aspergillus welwitschiae]
MDRFHHDSARAKADDSSSIADGVSLSRRRYSQGGPPGNDSIELERINTYRLQQQLTVGSRGSRIPQDQWLPIGAGKPYPPPLPDSEAYVVEFEGADDPMHPHNWPMKKRVMLGSLLTSCALVTAYGSAVFATAASGAEKEFGFGEEVAALGTTLYVLGFSAGPTVWAPSSELLGRRWPLLLGMFGFDLFMIATATAKDTQTLMLCRFFAGFCAASIIALVPASLSDVFNNHQRGVAIAMYTMSVFTGPFTAPFIGGYTASSYLGWRWTLYVPAIVGFFCLALIVFFTTETYAPIILVQKAAILRRQTRNWGIHARQDELEIDFKELVTKNLARPFLILFTEPIAFLLTLYMSFIYGLAYALLEAYPIIFEGTYGMTGGTAGLPLLALSLVKSPVARLFCLCRDDIRGSWRPTITLRCPNGVSPLASWVVRCLLVDYSGMILSTHVYNARLGGNTDKRSRFGWTGWNSNIHWMAPTAAGVAVGFGLTSIFMQCFNYILDTYSKFAASAFAANTMMRSMVGAVFPLFTRQMFNNLGIQWAGTLLGCIAVVMIPIPLMFYLFGGRLRQKSKLAPVMDLMPPAEEDIKEA